MKIFKRKYLIIYNLCNLNNLNNLNTLNNQV